MTYLPRTLGFEWRHRFDAYGTHQPVLYEAVKRTTGAILELGSGFNSTPLIHWTAGPHRQITTVDHDEAWLANFKHLSNDSHEFLNMDWAEMLRFYGPCGLVFIDQGLWESRAECVVAYAKLSQVVVIHDSDHMENHGFLKYADHYKYVKTFMPLQPYPYVTGPPTALLSNYVDITAWDIDYEQYK